MDRTPDPVLSPQQFGRAFKAFLDAALATAAPPQSPLLERIAEHLGTDPAQLPVVTEEFDVFEQPNLQVALDAYLALPEHRAELIGLAADARRAVALGLSDFLSRANPMRPPLSEGPVDYVNYRLAGDQSLACVQFGLYLVDADGEHLVVLVKGPAEHMGPRQQLRVEVMARRPEPVAGFLDALRAAMDRLNIYRGHVISLAPGQMGMGVQTLVAFHTLPVVRRADVVLPEHLLARIDRHTVGFAAHAEQLRAAGRSLKRGLLLYGLPGTGKTLTVMYLCHRLPGRTALLMTGGGMGLLATAVQLARKLAPATVVLEDVDLIAEERGHPGMRSGPLLFELLNELDGLRDDADVLFVLTTNRPDVLEPALAARPGRIDLAVELPLPDAAHRERLLSLYARGLTLEGVDLAGLAARLDGASPAYIKELLRRAAVLALTVGAATVRGVHLEQAMVELQEGGALTHRILGFHPAGEPSVPSLPRPGRPPGFPTGPLRPAP